MGQEMKVVLRWVLLVISLGAVAGSLGARRGACRFLSGCKPVLSECLSPRVPNLVHVVAKHSNGAVFYDHTSHNLRTNAGINWQYNQMAGTAAAACTYIALSNDSGTPAATDTSVASEITTNGLARANGTATHTSNATSYTVAYTFTATGTQSAQKAGLLNAASSGTLCFENTFTQVSMASGDTLTVTWTINF